MLKKIIFITLCFFVEAEARDNNAVKTSRGNQSPSEYYSKKSYADLSLGYLVHSSKQKDDQVRFSPNKKTAFSLGITKEITNELGLMLNFFSYPKGKAKSSYKVHVADYTSKNKYSNYAFLTGVKYKFYESDNFVYNTNLMLGVSKNKLQVDDNYTEENTSVHYGKKKNYQFAFGFGVDGEYKFSEKISLLTSYNYIDFGKAKTKSYATANQTYSTTSSPYKFNIRSHFIMLGVRYKF